MITPELSLLLLGEVAVLVVVLEMVLLFVVVDVTEELCVLSTLLVEVSDKGGVDVDVLPPVLVVGVLDGAGVLVVGAAGQDSNMPTQEFPQHVSVDPQQAPPQHCSVLPQGYSLASVQQLVVEETQAPLQQPCVMPHPVHCAVVDRIPRTSTTITR
jgi:hypothetical protein